MNRTVAALYVQQGGCYWGLDDVDAWDEERDARLYPGPYPVVAHPPCARWTNIGRSAWARWGHRSDLAPGNDGGCFAAALASVRQWGGVLEHPANSAAYAAFGLRAPATGGGWRRADLDGGWCCEVYQSQYGHRARKATWLYAVRVERPELRWGPGEYTCQIGGADSRGERNLCALSKRERNATPIEFRDLLLSIARSVK